MDLLARVELAVIRHSVDLGVRGQVGLWVRNLAS
jgi:hypothetical protein